jgi:AcrR family transcriptional regulator
MAKKANESAAADPIESAPEAPDASARRPGRPSADQKGGISRQSILVTALKLTKTCPLQDLSILLVARSMKVTPALIHYYIGGRDWLTSGVMNLFYRSLLKKWPDETDDWQADFLASTKVVYEHITLYGGIAAYLVSNSRFRIFQLTAFGDRDYGVETLERFTGRVRAAGLSGERTGIMAHLILEFIISTAHGTSHHIFPAEHRQFLEEKTNKLDPEKYPNIFFARRAPLELDGAVAFQEGSRLFLLGLIREAAGGSPAATAKMVEIQPAAKRARRPQRIALE